MIQRAVDDVIKGFHVFIKIKKPHTHQVAAPNDSNMVVAAQGPEDLGSTYGRDEVGPCFADSSPPSRELRSNGPRVTHHLGSTDNQDQATMPNAEEKCGATQSRISQQGIETCKQPMVRSLPVAPRTMTPLLVGKRLVPALQIPVHLPGSWGLRGHARGSDPVARHRWF